MLLPNKFAAEDKWLKHFATYLAAERNASAYTSLSYATDLAQMVTSKWGEAGEPPYDWKSFTEMDARAFLTSFTKEGAAPTTVRRKVAAARTFFRHLQREEVVLDNPFSMLRGPRKEKLLPKTISVAEIDRLWRSRCLISKTVRLRSIRRFAMPLSLRRFIRPVAVSVKCTRRLGRCSICREAR